MDVLGRDSVPVPFFDIECQECLVGMAPALTDETLEVRGQVFDKLIVEFLAKEVC